MALTGLLDGRAALITGSGSGQGRAAAVLFATQGARVFVVDVNDEGAAETVKMVQDVGGEAVALHADVSDRVACDAMVAACVEQLGRLDVLYNNAAVQMSGTLVDCTEDQWDLTIATNLSAIFWACRAAIPHMLASGWGTIVNTASTLALMGSPGYAAYGAAKAGLVSLTRQIASEYGPTIRANVIAPGSIDTPRFRKVAATMPAEYLARLTTSMPLKRPGTAEDRSRSRSSPR